MIVLWHRWPIGARGRRTPRFANGKAMHAGPIRATRIKLSSLARSHVRRFVLINETHTESSHRLHTVRRGTSIFPTPRRAACVVANAIAQPCWPRYIPEFSIVNHLCRDPRYTRDGDRCRSAEAHSVLLCYDVSDMFHIRFIRDAFTHCLVFSCPQLNLNCNT